MSDLTRPDRGEARERLEQTLDDLETEFALIYCRCALVALASWAPDVLTFLLDRVDSAFDDLEATLGGQGG